MCKYRLTVSWYLRYPAADTQVVSYLARQHPEQLAFFALHDTYHVGQMAYIRKALGYIRVSLADAGQQPTPT
jgi:uncharacterized damage-inducible protein DinB